MVAVVLVIAMIPVGKGAVMGTEGGSELAVMTALWGWVGYAAGVYIFNHRDISSAVRATSKVALYQRC